MTEFKLSSQSRLRRPHVLVFALLGACVSCGPDDTDQPGSGGGAGAGGAGATTGGADPSGGDDSPAGNNGTGGQAGAHGGDGGAPSDGGASNGGAAGGPARGGASGAGGTNGGTGGAPDNTGGAMDGGEGGEDGDGGDGGDGTGGVRPGFFDPHEVHLWGTLSEGLCYRDAVAPVLAPNVAATGFSCGTPDGSAMAQFGSFIHPTEQRLAFVYNPAQGPQTIALFHADATGTDPYPTAPFANDEKLVPVCVSPEEVWGIYVTPDTGELVYPCSRGGPCNAGWCTYYRESGAELPLPANHYLMAPGYNGSALLGLANALVLRNPAGEIIPLDADVKTTVRAHADGFWILKPGTTGTSPERWNVDFQGTLSREGQYPEPPESTVYAWPIRDGDFWPCKFDRAGRLYCFAESALDPQVDEVLRATLGASRAEVVYTEAANPLVRIHISWLVTGP